MSIDALLPLFYCRCLVTCAMMPLHWPPHFLPLLAHLILCYGMRYPPRQKCYVKALTPEPQNVTIFGDR